MLFEQLSDEQEETVLKEVGYTKEQLEVDVVTIREWLAEQPHLPPSRLKESDYFFKFYLTGCKGSLEKTKRKLDQYYTFRGHSQIYSCRDPAEPGYLAFKKIIYCGITTKPVGVENPFRIVYYKLIDLDPDKYDFLMFARMIVNLSELRMRAEPLSTRSFVIFDAEGWTAGHAVKIKPIIAKDCLRILLSVFPLRYAEIYVINVQSIWETTINTLFMPFVSKKMKGKVHITSGGYEEVCKHIDKDCLPEDYGGKSPNMKESTEKWFSTELKRRDWYVNELSERCDESKRIFQEDLLDDPYFGVPGSLKKLVVD